MISNQYACNSGPGKEYKSIIDKPNQQDKCITMDECEFIDFKDLPKLLDDTAKENLTSCYALDTTYMRTDFPSLLFGPLLESDITLDMNIGLILDIKLLRHYIGCMSIIDSGSVGRYNRKEYEDSVQKNRKTYIPNISQGPILKTDISDNDITNNYTKLVERNKGRGLAQAGCGLQSGYQGDNLSGIFNTELLPNGKVNKFKGANSVIQKKYNKKYSPFKDKNDLIFGSWGINSLPLRRTSWKYFIKLIKEKYAKIKEYGGNKKLWQKIMHINNANQYTNKYFENEVDIFIPNKDTSGSDKNCQPTDEFLEIWKKCIIGIFTNNRCVSDVEYGKVCDNCKKIQSYDCNRETCCCNKDFNERLVKNLVYRFNADSEQKINGYIMNDNYNPSKDYPEPESNGLYKLSIKQITDCKSYYNYPVKTQILNNGIKQYWYSIKCHDKNNNLICGPKDSTSRKVGITIPKNRNGKYIINFDFSIDIYSIGYSCNDPSEKISLDKMIGGVIDSKTMKVNCKKSGYSYGFDLIQQYFQTALEMGYTIIHFTECEYDYNAYISGKDSSDRSGNCSMYWDNENNSDARYFKSFFRELRCNNFVDNNHQTFNLNYNNIGLFGYSVGAQLVSRCVNDFPIMKTYHNNTGQTFDFPIIEFGIMVADGSLNCYTVNQNLCQKGLEPIYTTGYKGKHLNMDCHPYILLIQSDNDNFADKDAANKYFHSFNLERQGEYVKSNEKSITEFHSNQKVYCHYSVNSTIHGLTNNSQLQSIINFTDYLNLKM